MAIFSRKSKAEKAASKEQKKEPADLNPKAAPNAAASTVRSSSVGPRNKTAQGGKYFGHKQENRSDFYAASDVLPVPQPPYMSGSSNATPRSRMSRNDYFAQGTPSYNRDHSYPTLQYADSGYDSGSAMHSRAPSEKNFPEEYRTYGHSISTPYLPQLGLGDEAFGNDGNVSPVDHEAESRSIKSNKSSTSAYKKTRFEPEPMPALDLLQSHQSASRRATLSPLSILDGLKVNKRGRILDEEGDPIGELVDGDLLDCVRQKANGRGEVLDEYGRVVGAVRTIPTLSQPYQPAQTPAQSFTSQVEQKSAVPERTHSTRAEPSRPSLSLQTRSAQPSPEILAKPARQPQPVLQRLQDEPAVLAASILPAQSEATTVSLPTLYEPTTPILKLPEADLEPQRILQKEEPVAATTAQELRPQVKHEDGPVATPQIITQEIPTAAVEPAAKDFVAPSEPSKRIPRNSSERSLSDLGKTYVRPAMSSVPEDNVAEDVIMPVEGNAFAFKGEVPVDDRPQREARSRSPNVAINVKAALALGQPNSALLGQNPRMAMNNRRATTHFTGSYGASASGKSPITRPSPLSSQESSPGRSESGEDFAYEAIRPGHSRSASYISHATSMATSAPIKPRTYFTHGGKITVDANAAEAINAETLAPKAAPVEEKKNDKKKSRLSLSFGKKK